MFFSSSHRCPEPRKEVALGFLGMACREKCAGLGRVLNGAGGEKMAHYIGESGGEPGGILRCTL